MSFRDRILRAAGVTAGLAGEMLQELAKATLDPKDQDQADTDVQPELEDTALAPPRDHTRAGGVVREPAEGDPQSLFWDPFSIIEQMGYRDRPSSITYGTLDAILWRMPIVQTIVQTRVNQVAAFCRPQRDRYQLGYKIKLREAEDKPSPADKRWMKRCEGVLSTTGVTSNMRSRDTLEAFVKKIVRDSLVYDQMGFEVVPNRLGKPAEWYAVDGRTLRLADTATMHLKQNVDTDVKYVQIYDGMIVSEYRTDELCFGVRNPRADIRLYGYGTSELEMLINCITSMLYAWEYNTKAFSQGVSQKGVLNFKGAIPEVQLRQFRRHFHSQVAGVENAFKTPIVNAEDLQWVNMQSSSRDMEYNAWMDFLIKVACAMYTIDPVEINFKYGNTGQKSGMQEASNKEKVTESKERGLRPLLQFVADCINQYIVWPMNENFSFDFVGLDAKTQDALIDLNGKRVKTSMMVDEIRAEEDKPPLPDGKGQVILDPTWQQFSQGIDAQAQAAAEGEEGEEDFDEQGFAEQMGGEQPEEEEAGEAEAGPPPAAAAAGGGGEGGAPSPFGRSESYGRDAVVIDLKL